jgi:ribulose-5-phosphate 4-epimerase/fuculose-1-phosphate aldolase
LPDRRKSDCEVKVETVQAPELLRDDVALANRIIESAGLASVFGHASARIPGTSTFLLPARRSPAFSEASTLLTMDLDGNVVAGAGTPNSEFWIHARIYAARRDVGGVVHAHPHGCVCLTQLGRAHHAVHNQGGPFHVNVGEHDRIGLIRSRELGNLLAQSLGDKIAVMMRGHGITTACADVRTATIAAIWLEESAALQLRMLAAAAGDATQIQFYTPEESGRVDDQLSPGIVQRAWEYHAAVAAQRSLVGWRISLR